MRLALQLLVVSCLAVFVLGAVNPPDDAPPVIQPKKAIDPCAGRSAMSNCVGCVLAGTKSCEWTKSTNTCGARTVTVSDDLVRAKADCPNLQKAEVLELRNPTIGLEWEFMTPKLTGYAKVESGVASGLEDPAMACAPTLIKTKGDHNGRSLVLITLDLSKGVTGTMEIVSAPIQFNDEIRWLAVTTYIAGFMEHAQLVGYEDGKCKVTLTDKDKATVGIPKPCVVSINDVFNSMKEDSRFKDNVDWEPVLVHTNRARRTCGMLLSGDYKSGYPQVNIATKVEAWGSGAVLPLFQYGIQGLATFTAGNGAAKQGYEGALAGLEAWLDAQPEMKAYKTSNEMKGLWALFIHAVNAQTRAAKEKLSAEKTKNAFDLYSKAPLNSLFIAAEAKHNEGKAAKAFWDRVVARSEQETVAEALNTAFCAARVEASCKEMFKGAISALFTPSAEFFANTMAIPKPVAPFEQDNKLCVVSETRTGLGVLPLELAAEIDILAVPPPKHFVGKFKYYSKLREIISQLP